MFSSVRYLRHMFSIRKYALCMRRLISPFISLDPTPSPVLIMTLLVRNEEGMLEKNILFHKSMGVDAFIITDNNSTDGTPEIIKKYVDRGWVVGSIIEYGNNYDQARWVDRMIRLAAKKHQADWIINADADELWFSARGNLKEDLSDTTSNVILCPLYNVIPENSRIEEWCHVVKHPLEDPQSYGLSKYSIFGRQSAKVVHRAKGYRRISMGNHSVEMKYSKISNSSTISIYHYPIQSYEQFKNKIIIGGRALQNNAERNVGIHCRYLYDLYLRGSFDDEYERIIGNNLLDQLEIEGVVVQDSTLSIFLKESAIWFESKC